MKYLKSLFQKPSAAAMAQSELDDARRELLQAQSAKDYATQMVLYHESRIRRLDAFLNAQRAQ